jgi:hypothetical protein
VSETVPIARGGSGPVFFDADGEALFGNWHVPDAGAPSLGGAIVCGSWGHEYFAAHRAVRQLAVRLAQAGWCTLRFDCFGSGDSAGASDDGRVSRWIADVSAAGQEVGRALPAAPTPTLIGLRLGASIALLHQQQGPLADRLVLWDPVIGGRAWLEAQVALHASRLEGSPPDHELLGAPLSDPLHADLTALDLLAVTRAPARVLLIDGPSPTPDSAALADRLRAFGSTVDRQSVAYPPGWLDPGSAVVPAAAIQAIVSWLRRQSAEDPIVSVQR